MNVGGEREAEGSQRDCPGRMQRRRTRRAAQAIVLIADVRRGQSGARQPRRQPPHAHMIGVGRLGERGENHADDDVRGGDENHPREPAAT